MFCWGKTLLEKQKMLCIFSRVTVVTVTLFSPRIPVGYPRQRPQVADQTPFQKPFIEFRRLWSFTPQPPKLCKSSKEQFKGRFFSRELISIKHRYSSINAQAVKCFTMQGANLDILCVFVYNNLCICLMGRTAGTKVKKR